MDEQPLLIRSVHAFGPEDLGIVDIAVRDGSIVQIGPKLEAQGSRVIDGRGLIALPGLIETHAHMLLPFGGTRTMNDFYQGTRAGAFGGVTALIDFADQVRGGTIEEALKQRLEQAGSACAVDYSFHCTLTDITPETLEAIPRLVARGFSSFKFYTTYEAGGLRVPLDDLRRAFAVISRCGAIATVHAEDEDLINAATRRLIDAGKTGVAYFPQSKPEESEVSMIARLIRLAEETGVKLLIRHVSSRGGARLIAQAQGRGLEVYGETCPHYLYFDDRVYAGADGARFLVHPPIRTADDREGLWEALSGGVRFTIGTDDCAFFLAQKHMSNRFYEIPGGMPGIESRLLVLYELGVLGGRITTERFVELTAETPAKLYGLPQKGRLAVGCDGDIVLLEACGPYRLTAAQLHENCDYTPFEGMELHARVHSTIARGRIVVEGGESRTLPGAGRLLGRGLPERLVRAPAEGTR